MPRDRLQISTQVDIEYERTEWNDRRDQRFAHSLEPPAQRQCRVGNGSDKQDEQQSMGPPHELNRLRDSRDVLERHRDAQ